MEGKRAFALRVRSGPAGGYVSSGRERVEVGVRVDLSTSEATVLEAELAMVSIHSGVEPGDAVKALLALLTRLRAERVREQGFNAQRRRLRYPHAVPVALDPDPQGA